MSLKHLLLTASLGLSSAAFGVGGSVSIDYTKNFVPADPIMNIGLGLSHNASKYLSFSLTQGIEKNLIIDASTREFEASDTVLGLSYRMLTPVKTWNWKLGASARLPVSKQSQHDDVITRLGFSLGLVYAGIFDFAATTRADYQFNRYQSSPGENGEGGNPLYHYGYGAALSLGKTFAERVTLSLDGNYRETRYEDIPFEGTGVPKISYDSDQAYSVGASISSVLWEKAELGLSLSQGRLLEQEGWADYVIFDKTESTWTLSFSQAF